MFVFKTKIIIAFLFPLILSLITLPYQAINSSCIDNNNRIYYPNNSQIYIKAAPFNYVIIKIDLRHLISSIPLQSVSLQLQLQNQDISQVFTEYLKLNVSVNTYTLHVQNNIIISALFLITQATQQRCLSKSYLFGQSVSITIIPANQNGQQVSFLFVVTNQDQISLPYNMISINNVNSFSGYFITQQLDLDQMQSRQNTIPSYSDYWNGITSVALPYFPYFSNCKGFGDYVYFQQAIHNQSQCVLYGSNSVPINQFSFGSKATADTCMIKRDCIYDQIPGTINEYPFWNTLDSSQTYLFYVTTQQLSASNIPNQNFNQKDLVPCKLKSSSGSNASGEYPLKVTLSFGYYQITNDKRKILTCQVDYSLYIVSAANFTYQLQMSFFPLNHTQILLNFGFDWYIYMLVFMIIGVVSNLQFLIFWIYHLFTTQKTTRTFNIKVYLRMIKQIAKGSSFAFLITISIVFSVQVIMCGTFFGSQLFGVNFYSFWDYFVFNNIGYFADNNLVNARYGRMGATYLIISGYIMVLLSDALIGKQRDKKLYEDYQIMGRKFKPQQWNRGKFLFGTFFMIILSLTYLYFTYTSVFSNNIWIIIVMVQILQMILEEIIFSIYDDQLPCLPLKLAIGVLAYLATMGAIDLYYFILGYLVDVAISTIEIAYLSQLQETITQFVQHKSEQLNKFYINLLNDDEDDVDKVSKAENNVLNNNQFIFIDSYLNDVEFLQAVVEQSHLQVDLKDIPQYDGQADLKAKFVQSMVQKNEKLTNKQQKYHNNQSFVRLQQQDQQKIQLQNKKFQLILDCTTNMLQYMLQPIIVLILWITYSTSNILSSFQISNSTCILYLLSSIILAIFFQFNVIIIFHVLQLYLNIDIKVTLKTFLSRFQNKTTFWITDQDQTQQNSKMEIKLRGAHNYGVSSQMFFIVSLYVCCMYMFIVGVTTIVQAQFNIFKDQFSIFITIFWIIFLEIFRKIVQKILQIFDIWGYSSHSKQMNNDMQNDEGPSVEEQTQQILLQQSMSGSSFKFTFKHLSNQNNQRSVDSDIDNEKKKIAEARLKTICKKLQPQFQKQSFRLQFARKNKDFIRHNIEKILPLVDSFPDNDGFLLSKTANNKQGYIKKQTKNCQPYISDFLASWLKRTETNRTKRMEDGVERQRKLKKCNFCFNTWNLYFGYDGMCLKCSKLLFEGKKQTMKQD